MIRYFCDLCGKECHDPRFRGQLQLHSEEHSKNAFPYLKKLLCRNCAHVIDQGLAQLFSEIQKTRENLP